METYEIPIDKSTGWNLITQMEWPQNQWLADALSFARAVIMLKLHPNNKLLFEKWSVFHNPNPCKDDCFSERYYPVTLRNSRAIIIVADGTNYLQALYQFAHEMMHASIPKSANLSWKWLEETICELSSIVVLSELYRTNWLNHRPVYITDAVYNSTPKYVANIRGKAIAIEESIPAFLQTHIETLRKDCRMRNHNATMAVALEPVFQQYPELWCAVPYLCEIPEGVSFAEGIQYWSSLVPDLNLYSRIAPCLLGGSKEVF